MSKGLLFQILLVTYGVAAIIRTQEDDKIRKQINEIWNNQIEIELTGEETEEEIMEKRRQELEQDPRYQELKKELDDLYNTWGDSNDKINGKIPFGQWIRLDVNDWVEDETDKSPKKETIATSWTEKKEDILTIFEGEIKKVNISIKYVQDMTFVRYFSDIVRANDLNVADYGEMMNKQGDVEDKDIRIVYTYDCKMNYENDEEKIDTSTPAKIEKTDKGFKITKTIKVYQDSFKAEATPNLDSETDTVQFGFIFEEDPLKTKKEFEQEARNAMTTYGTINVKKSYEYAKTHNRSKNACSYYQSEEYFDEHKDDFLDTDKVMLKAHDKDGAQTALTFFCYDIYNEFNNRISEEIKEKYGDVPVDVDIILRAYDCNFEDRTDETKYEEVNLSKIDWPENLEDIKNIRNELPSVGGEKRENEFKIINASELKKIKEKVFSGDDELPQLEEGETSAQEEKWYLLYDWEKIEKEIEEESEEEQEQEEQSEEEKVGLENNGRKLCLSDKNDMNYTASKGNQYLINNIKCLREDEIDICYKEEDIEDLEI